jgi:hypothetical protein
MRTVLRIFVGKSEGKRPLGSPRHWWVNNIKMDFGELRWCGMYWIGSINAGKFFGSCTTDILSGRAQLQGVSKVWLLEALRI